MTSQNDVQVYVSRVTGSVLDVQEASMPATYHFPSGDPATCLTVATKRKKRKGFFESIKILMKE